MSVANKEPFGVVGGPRVGLPYFDDAVVAARDDEAVWVLLRRSKICDRVDKCLA